MSANLSATSSSAKNVTIDDSHKKPKAVKTNNNAASKLSADSTTEGSDETTDGKKEGGRSIFLKIHDDTYVHHTLFKDLLTIATTLEGDGARESYNLRLGFRDGREVSVNVQAAELTKITKRMKEYAKCDHTEAGEQKGRSTFLKIHHETYVHHTLFKDLLTVSSDKEDDSSKYTGLQLGFRDGRQIATRVEKEETTRVVKRVKEFAKKYGSSHVNAGDGVTDTETESGDPVNKVTDKKKGKNNTSVDKGDGLVRAKATA